MAVKEERLDAFVGFCQFFDDLWQHVPMLLRPLLLLLFCLWESVGAHNAFRVEGVQVGSAKFLLGSESLALL